MNENPEAITELAKHWEPLISLLIVGLLQVMKTAMPSIPVRIVPLMSLVLGIGFIVSVTGFNIETVIAGMMIGFAASGIYSSGVTVAVKKEATEKNES